MESNLYNASINEVIDQIVRVIKNLRWTIEENNLGKGYFIVSTGFSWRSWGENIRIDIIGKGNRTEVKVASTARAQLYDWGKSNDNEKKIIKKLNHQIG